MKKILLLSLSCLAGLQLSQAQVSFTDDFEAYNVNSYLGPQSPNWTTWSTQDGTTEDVMVIDTKAHSGTKSIYFTSTSATGGPSDVVLPFQGPHNTGSFVFKAYFYVAKGKNAYFNYQASNTTGQTWSVDCFMNKDSSLVFSNSGTTMLSAKYPQESWFEIKVDANLNNSLWNVSINGTVVGTFHNPVYKIALIDIYPVDADASFWVDDVSFTHTPFTLPSVNGGLTFLTVSKGLVGQQRTPIVEVRNLGTTAITSYDITFGNGASQTTQSITGVNVASLATATVTATAPVTLTAGANTVWAKISKVNGVNPDGNASDDSTSLTINPAKPALGKMVVAEEGTGTWCSWCVRGHVVLKNMEKYDGYFQGIAVHNNDPMAYTPYDSVMGTKITGYPSGFVDRGNSIDPLAFEEDFFKRIILTPKALLLNGAVYDAVNNVLKVSIKTTFQQAVSGDFRVACVLVEDSVKGTTSDYDQKNAYANNANGVMGGYETLPAVVPAAQMQYDHVGRLISPNFFGFLNSFPATVSSGASYVHNFTLFLDPTWRTKKMKIVGMLIDPSGKIENAASVSFSQAITNGFLPGIDVTIGVKKLYAPDQAIKFYPNPVANYANLEIQLEMESTVAMEIYSIEGKLVAARNYGKIANANILPVNTEQFKAGVYFIKLFIEGKPSVIKFVKE